MLTILAAAAMVQVPSSAETARWKAEAARVAITRDDWGIAHVHGHSDADAVFGMIYAQAEDDFSRIEANYLTNLGRQAEAGDDSKFWQDVRSRLFNDPETMRKQFGDCPKWLQKLMIAWADGLNYYLATHPETHPKLLRRFEPWMTLAFSEGSIGGDSERIDTRGLEAFYGANSVELPPKFVVRGRQSAQGLLQKSRGLSEWWLVSGGRGQAPAAEAANQPMAEGSGTYGRRDARAPVTIAADAPDEGDPDPGGSNGIAIGPSNTADHHSLLLINPHTSFFFRSELQVSSDQGLNAYGAATWGQFFIYQGFNERCGWMHTSSGVDAVDEYAETVTPSGRGWVYKYGNETRPVITKPMRVGLSSGDTKMVTALYTCHGPIIGERNGKLVTIQLMQRPIQALEQSFLRTKTRSYADYLRTMDMRANSSNNTIFADADGDIAYFHGNFIPKRDPKFDFTKLVDGSDPATDWHGLLSVDETPHVLNPSSGYVFNVNNWPWTCAGKDSPKQADFPKYVEKGGDSERGVHAVRLLDGKSGYTRDGLLSAAFDSYLPWFEKPIPALLKAWDGSTQSFNLRSDLREPIETLRNWNLRWGADSVGTTLAIFWGEQLRRSLGAEARAAGLTVEDYAGSKASGDELVESLRAACGRLTREFGAWKTAWGEINRFQRLDDRIDSRFDDNKPSIPVPFTASDWGSLAAFGARPYPNTKRWYGTSGNSFVAVVEFGPRVRARAVTAGGESGDPSSKHFDDEAGRYASGNFREVYFYPDQLTGHTERLYRPGE